MEGNITTHFTPSAISYAWKQLADRAGIPINRNNDHTKFECLNLSIVYSDLEKLPELYPDIVIIPAPLDAYQRLFNTSPGSLDWVNSRDTIPSGTNLSISEKIPILFWGEGYDKKNKPFVEKNENGTVIFYVDILLTAFFMLSRVEETIISKYDRHNRHQAIDSIAYQQKFLDQPIVDEYALVLQAWIKTLLPGWIPQPKKFSIKLTHDIDTVRLATWLRAGGDIINRHNLGLAVNTINEIIHPEKDAALRGMFELATLSENYEQKSAFYFMSANPGRREKGIDVNSSHVQKIISELRQRGHEIGFHPSYYAYDDPQLFFLEKQRMDKALKETHYGGRQHYLRFHVPNTWRIWEGAGLSYDSTLSYFDHEGFRCGTCHPYHPFDIENDRQMEIVEIPLIIMDGTLKVYRRLTCEESENVMITLAQRCRQVGGVFTILWHNISLYGIWESWGDMYRRIIPRLVGMVD